MSRIMADDKLHLLILKSISLERFVRSLVVLIVNEREDSFESASTSFMLRTYLTDFQNTKTEMFWCSRKAKKMLRTFFKTFSTS